MTTTLSYQQLEPKSASIPDACVIWLHGLGATADDFIPLIPQLGLPENHAIRFVFPQAPIQPVSINNGSKMPSWFDILGLGLKSEQDEAGIRAAEILLISLIDAQIAAGIASDKIVLVGFSQGGALALHTGLRFQKRLAGIMALSTYLPIADFLEEEKSAINYGLPIFVAHGTKDAVLPIEAAEITCQYLRDVDYAVEERIYPMGHEVCAAEVRDLSAWLVNVLDL